MGTWQVQEAKSRFSELIEEASTNGPQIITRHGVEQAVVISIEDYRAMPKPKPSFKDWLLNGPKVGDIDITRSPDTGRDIDL